METEQWMPVPGFEKTCAISNYGRFKTIARVVYDSIGRSRAWPECEIRPRLMTSGYRMVGLGQGRRRKDVAIHRIVALVFVPNPDNKPHVNHEDGNKLNNYFGNLEWVTCAENIAHARRELGARSNYELSKADIDEINHSASADSRELARRFGVHRSTIYKVWKKSGVVRFARAKRLPDREATSGQFKPSAANSLMKWR